MQRPYLAGCACAALCAFACTEEAPSDAAPDNPVCRGDYSELPASAVSLEHDLIPIFRASCTFSSCHDRSAMKAGLVLGDPNSPIESNLLEEVRDSLLAPSETVKSPVVPRVTPGDPTKSFLLDKVTGTQNERGYAQCENQVPSGSTSGNCGNAMPIGDATFCATQPEKVLAIARWIEDGAPQN